MKNIVIATDLKPETKNALKRALLLAEEHKAQLHIIHIQSKLDIPNLQVQNQQHKENAIAEIESLVKAFSNYDNVKIEILSDGRIQDLIDNYARKIDADLVILGADRSMKGSPSFIRTKAENILRQGNYPVLIVFRNVTSLYENILVIGKQYTASFLDLINKNHQEKKRKTINKKDRTHTKSI